MKISISRRNIVVAGCLAGIAAWTLPSQAAPVSFKVALTGAQQVPPVQTGANGMADLSYDPATRMLTWSVTYNGLSGPATMAHFHGPAQQLTAGEWYVNVHTQANPNGEIRGQVMPPKS